MKIPKSFQLGPHLIQVKLVTKAEMVRVEDGEDAPWGMWKAGENAIYVQKPCRGFNKSHQLHAFWHEYFHALFDCASRTKLSQDEILVDQLGGLHMQAMQTWQTKAVSSSTAV